VFGDGWWSGFVFAGGVFCWVGFGWWMFGMYVAEGEETIGISIVGRRG